MSLINCPECNKEISDTSKSCINCGYILNRKKQSKKLKIAVLSSILVVVVVAIVLVLSSGKFMLNEYEKVALRDYEKLLELFDNPEDVKITYVQVIKNGLNGSDYTTIFRYFIDNELFNCVTMISDDYIVMEDYGDDIFSDKGVDAWMESVLTRPDIEKNEYILTYSDKINVDINLFK